MANLSPGTDGLPLLAGGLLFPMPALLMADGIANFGPATQKWGVYLGAAPVVVFDTFVSIDFRRGWALSDYPVERGAFETYDKVQLPFDVRVRFAAGGTEANRQALLDSIATIAGTLTLYSVVTPEIVYNSVNVQHYDYRRTSTNGQGMITVELWLLEVRVTGDASSGAGAGDASGNPIGNTAPDGNGASGTDESGFLPQDPSGNDPSNDGNVTPIIPTPIDNPYGFM